jgi:glycosyltransferase involved in cell wall biosynthesis
MGLPLIRQTSFLFFSNKDIQNPVAGGGTWELFRLMRMLVERKHLVTLICSNYPGGKKEESIEGINVVRIGNLYTVFFLAMLKYLSSKKLRDYDVIVDVALMGIPFFTRIYTRKPVFAIVWHLPREVFFIELTQKIGRLLGFISATLARFVEDVITPLFYSNVPLFTFSKSTQIDLEKTGLRNVVMKEYALARAIMHGAVREDLIKTQDFNPGKEKNNSPMFICLGRLKKYKGVQDAIKAMSLLAKGYPDSHLYVIGHGDYEPQLKALSKELKVENNVHFLGFISLEDKIEMYQKAHALIMPSYKEGFATPVFEANMCGTIAVVSNAIGVGESVKHEQTGFVYPLGNYQRMASYLELIIKDRERRQRLEENAKKWATRFYELNKTEKEFIEEFENRASAYVRYYAQ